MYLCVYMCMFMCVCVYVCLCIHVFVYVLCLCVCVYVISCVCSYVCIYVYVCISSTSLTEKTLEKLIPLPRILILFLSLTLSLLANLTSLLFYFFSGKLQCFLFWVSFHYISKAASLHPQINSYLARSVNGLSVHNVLCQKKKKKSPHCNVYFSFVVPGDTN